MSSSLGDALFTKTQQKVLALLYGNPGQSFYTNEIVRWADMGRGTVRRELEKLTAVGLLQVRREGNQHHYRANEANPIYEELLGIVRKTFGIADVIREALEPVAGQFELAFIYGSVAKGEDSAASDIDLLLVSNSLAFSDVMALLSNAEPGLRRQINPSIYSKEQLHEKLAQNNAFVGKVMAQPKIWIKGNQDDLGQFG